MDAKQRVKARFKKRYYFDFELLTIVCFLLAFGLVMLLSTSNYEATITFHNPYYYFKKQVISMAFGLVLFFILTFTKDYHILYKKFILLSYVASNAVLFLVKTSLAYSANGATRWIRIFGLSVQPSELTKFGMIVFLAGFISKIGKKISTRNGLVLTSVLVLIPVFLVYKVTRNLSTAIIIAGIAYVMLFIACEKKFPFIALVVIVVVMAVGLVVYAKANINGNLDFRMLRILAWLDPQAYASTKGQQILQSLYAIGSGGLFGKGLGESVQKLGPLPEAQNDMIFAIICEELGFFGAAVVLIMFMILIWRLKKIADSAPDMFGALLVIGVMAHISIQVMLNLAVVTNTIPNTGITLPFISYGGSAIAIQLAELGIASNVARFTPVYDDRR